MKEMRAPRQSMYCTTKISFSDGHELLSAALRRYAIAVVGKTGLHTMLRLLHKENQIIWLNGNLLPYLRIQPVASQ